MFEKLGGRKLVASIVVMLVGIITTIIKGDIPPGLLNLLEVTLGAFVGGNVVNSVVGAIASRGAPSDSADVEAEPVGAPPAAAAPATPVPTPEEHQKVMEGLIFIANRIDQIEGQIKTVTESNVVITRAVNEILKMAAR